MNAIEMANDLASKNPNHLFAYSSNMTSVAYRPLHEGCELWTPYATIGTDNKWYAVHMMLLVNGEPLFKQEDWIAV